jgi:tellurite resistance protein TerC
VLIVVETTDLVFALDSIPAVFAVTKDPFIVYTSNVFAILGLRSLYFLLARVINRFHYLELGLSMVLVFVGLKMLLEEIYHVPIGLSLGVVGFILIGSVIASLIFPQSDEQVPVLHDPLEPPPPGTTSPVEPSEPPGDDAAPIEPLDTGKRTSSKT